MGATLRRRCEAKPPSYETPKFGRIFYHSKKDYLVYHPLFRLHHIKNGGKIIKIIY